MIFCSQCLPLKKQRLSAPGFAKKVKAIYNKNKWLYIIKCPMGPKKLPNWKRDGIFFFNGWLYILFKTYIPHPPPKKKKRKTPLGPWTSAWYPHPRPRLHFALRHQRWWQPLLSAPEPHRPGAFARREGVALGRCGAGVVKAKRRMKCVFGKEYSYC